MATIKDYLEKKRRDNPEYAFKSIRYIYDDETGNVVRSNFTVRFDKSKTSAKLQGQKRTILVTEAGEEPQWFGLPELYDGTL